MYPTLSPLVTYKGRRDGEGGERDEEEGRGGAGERAGGVGGRGLHGHTAQREITRRYIAHMLLIMGLLLSLVRVLALSTRESRSHMLLIMGLLLSLFIITELRFDT